MRDLSYSHTLTFVHTRMHLPIHLLQQQGTHISSGLATLLEVSVTPT